MIKESYLAPCWIAGEPKEDGLYLIRFILYRDSDDAWYYFYECRKDTYLAHESRNRMMLFDNKGGNYSSDTHVRQHGTLTHHCKATGENFSLVMDSMGQYTFNHEKMEWQKI